MQQPNMGVPPGMSMMNPGGDALPSLLSMNVEAPAELNLADLKLPQALEQALAFKSERAKEIGVDDDGSQGKANFRLKYLLMIIFLSQNLRMLKNKIMTTVMKEKMAWMNRPPQLTQRIRIQNRKKGKRERRKLRN